MEDTELGVVTSTGSGGLNLVAMMKNDRIRNAISTKGVMSLSGACFFIFTLGMFLYLRLMMLFYLNSIMGYSGNYLY
jgi:hypothetical protein